MNSGFFGLESEFFEDPVYEAISAAPLSFEQLSASLSERFQCAYNITMKLANDFELKYELEEFRRAMKILQKEIVVCESEADGKAIALLK